MATTWEQKVEWADQQEATRKKIEELKAKGEWHEPSLLVRDKKDGKDYRIVAKPWDL